MDLIVPFIVAESSVYANESIQDLIDKVRRKVQDDSYSNDDIIDFFNAAMAELAGEFLLPNLETWETVYTDPMSSTIRMPANYHKNLRNCHSTTNRRRIKVYGSKQLLHSEFGWHDRNGRVLGIAPHGRDLYYQHIPNTAETLELNYWKFPDRITSVTQMPDILPPHMLEPLLVAYAAKEIFAEIEDGIEGKQINTERWERRWLVLKVQLDRFVGPEERVPDDFDADIEWDCMVNL